MESWSTLFFLSYLESGVTENKACHENVFSKSVCYSMYFQRVPLEVLLIFQHVTASWMSALESLLIGFATKMSFQVFVEEVSA
jgi:hypothetical protein